MPLKLYSITHVFTLLEASILAYWNFKKISKGLFLELPLQNAKACPCEYRDNPGVDCFIEFFFAAWPLILYDLIKTNQESN